MVAVVDVHQLVEFTVGQAGSGTRESQVTRVSGKSSDRDGEQVAIAPLERADIDDAPVAEHQSFGLAHSACLRSQTFHGTNHERDTAREPFASAAP